MKKILAIICVVLMLFSLASCGKNDKVEEPNVHFKHEFESEKVVTAPTCSEQGYTTLTCKICREKVKTDYTDALGHNFVKKGENEYACSRCGKDEAEWFTLSFYEQIDGYVVMSVNRYGVINGVLRIPMYYRKLPVKGIYAQAFADVAKYVKKMIVTENIEFINGRLFSAENAYESVLEEVQFEQGCKNIKINRSAFYGCKKLSKVTGVKDNLFISEFAGGAANGNRGNCRFLYEGTEYFKNNATQKDGVYYLDKMLLHVDLENVGKNITITDGTILISDAAFYYVYTFTSVKIPKSIKYIGDDAFKGNKQLTSIVYDGTMEEFLKINLGIDVFNGVGCKSIICSDGEITSYKRFNGTYTEEYKIGG